MKLIDKDLLLLSAGFAKQRKYWENKLAHRPTATILFPKENKPCTGKPGQETTVIQIPPDLT
ncbi:MAG: hypothetical protein GY757_12030, partial [bacterium]|nr:hypothetical protein [bacterium]